MALLIGLVVLTIGLGVASRSITDIKLSRQEEESARTFNVAEAGIEELLKEADLTPFLANPQEGPVEGTDIQRSITVEDVSTAISLGKAQVLEINTRDFTGDIYLKPASAVTMAVMVYHQEGNDYSVRREMHDGETWITGISEEDKFVRVKVYGATDLTVYGEDLPPQAFKITSRAQAPVGETRQVEVERTAPGLPSIFDYVLFSGDKLIE